MKGIIIAGGLGSRMRPLTYYRPKHILPIANQPLLEYQIALFQQHGITDIVFATGYLGDCIRQHFGDGSNFGVRMQYANEEAPLGTGGAIRNAAQFFPEEAVVVFNGDILTDFDLTNLVSAHQRANSIATIALYPVPGPSPYGVVIRDEHNRIVEWREPSPEEKKRLSTANHSPAVTEYINAGIYVLEPEAISAIPLGSISSIERDIFPRLIQNADAIYGHTVSGFWLDVGDAKRYLVANKAVLTEAVNTKVASYQCGKDCNISQTAIISPDTSIGFGTTIGDESVLSGCVIGSNVRIGNHVTLRDVVVDDGSVLEDEVVLTHCVLAAESIVRKGSHCAGC